MLAPAAAEEARAGPAAAGAAARAVSHKQRHASANAAVPRMRVLEAIGSQYYGQPPPAGHAISASLFPWPSAPRERAARGTRRGRRTPSQTRRRHLREW